MSQKVRRKAGGRFEIDTIVQLPDGSRPRDRVLAPLGLSPSAVKRWAEERGAWFRKEMMKAATEGRPVSDAVPTLEQFAPRFIREYARARQQKASGVASKESVLKRHLLPAFGHKPLNEINAADVAKLMASMQEDREAKAKTVNNVLSVLSKLLKVAVEWGVILEVPTRISLLETQDAEMTFYEPGDYEELLQAGAELGPNFELLVRLGGDLGLRRGEIIGLRWSDVDLGRRFVTIQNNVVHGTPGGTKGMKPRRIPIEDALAGLLESLPLPRTGYLLRDRDGDGPSTAKQIRIMMQRVQTKAGVPDDSGKLHILRHTFCSHLAMAGANVLEIQRLAGHADMKTTLRYMHLVPGEDFRSAMSGLARIRRGGSAQRTSADTATTRNKP